MLLEQAALLLSITSLVAGLSIIPRDIWTDPPFSVPNATMDAAITCPNGIKGKTGGIIFLVHGTGGTAVETWAKGPYTLILPDIGPGYDVCMVELPGKALGHAATSAEYVAYGIQQLAAKSKTGKAFVIGHSQGGGLSIPWSLDFFPNTKQFVSGFVALNGDFHGTLLGGPVCASMNLDAGHCAESVWQQDLHSEFLRAQNTDAGHALVGTTSIYTLTDEIIPPEPYTSILEGATNILIQDLKACGPVHVADHFLAPFDSGYFGIVLDALAHGGVANVERFDKSYCHGFKGNGAVNTKVLGEDLKETVADLLAVLTAQSPYVSTSEPPLPEYVCQRYPNDGYKCAKGLLN